MQAVKNPVETGAASLGMEYKRAKRTQHSWWASAGTSSRFWMYHRYRARLYGLRIPRGACIPSNPQECATGTHSILAILTISSSTSSSDRPREPSIRLYTNHPFRSIHIHIYVHAVAQRVSPDLSLRCTTIPLLVHACRFIRRLVGTCKWSLRDKKGILPVHLYSAFNSCNSTVCDDHSERC